MSATKPKPEAERCGHVYPALSIPRMVIFAAESACAYSQRMHCDGTLHDDGCDGLIHSHPFLPPAVPAAEETDGE